MPGDLSSATFFLVAALLVKESNLVIHGVGLNPTRSALLDFLGGRETGFSRSGDRFVRGSPDRNGVRGGGSGGGCAVRDRWSGVRGRVFP